MSQEMPAIKLPGKSDFQIEKDRLLAMYKSGSLSLMDYMNALRSIMYREHN